MLPAVVGIVLGERFPPLGYAALVVVVIAGILLAATPESGRRKRPSGRALFYAGTAGVGFAGVHHRDRRDARRVGARAAVRRPDRRAACCSPIALLVRRMRNGPAELAGLRDRTATLQALAAGVLLVTGNILLVVGLHLGDLAVMGVLNSLYPLGTVLLAIIVLQRAADGAAGRRHRSGARRRGDVDGGHR